MKHCAKKLLGLAFALALCLAVGGNALADGPEAADVWMLSDVWMLADEPNVTTAPDTTTVGDLANDGYTVTIPTTVEVNSTTNKGTLMVTAKLKQYRTLTIGIQSTNDEWQLKYNTTDENATDIPRVKYTLSTNDDVIDKVVAYYDGTNTLYYGVGQIDTSEENYDAETKSRKFTTNFNVKVPTPSQATMSGTYSDTLTFTYTLAKHCVTYTINVYEQELHLKNDGTHIEAVDRVDSNGQLKDPTSQPKETYVLEYGCADALGNPLGAAVTEQDEWTRPRPDGTEGDEDTRCWENLSYTMTPKVDYDARKTTQTINLNLKRKWYWLDVNGATDYTGTSGQESNGNQGGRISGYVDIKVSADDGATWSDWFWYKDGDDYWEQLPYGVHFKLGLHHVKNGYVYDMGTDGGVKIIANKQETKTAPGEKEGDTTYYVYKGTLTGEWTDTVEGNKNRYCYIPCYKKGLTYMANQGTGGKEDVNGANKPRTNVLYQEDYALESPEDLNIHAPSADMVFAGWSTKSTYTTGNPLYEAGTYVKDVQWETYTSAEMTTRPKNDTQKRVLYAIWGYKTDIKIAFENKMGSTDKNALGVFETVQIRGVEHEQTLKTDAIVIPGQTLTLDLNDTAVTAAINTATTAVDSSATEDKIWDLKKEYTITVPENKANMPQFKILRKRYLLNIMAVLSTGGLTVQLPATKAEAEQYGKFHVNSNGICQTADEQGKTSVYQWLRNYGGTYDVYNVEANTGYKFIGFVVPSTSGDPTSAGNGTTDLTATLTGKNSNISYFDGDGTTYEGDTIYVVFEKVTATPGSTTPMPGPSLAPARKALTLRYHANFDPNEELALDLDPDPLLDDMDDTFGFDPDPLLEDVDDALEGAVKTVSYQPGEDVVLRNCMFKRSGYVFVGWNTEPDGTGRLYRVNGVPITDWAAGDTVDLYAQWKKPDHLKPVVDNEPFVPTDPDTPPEELDPGFGIDPDADPADEEGPADDADAVDDAPAVADEEAAATPPEELDFGFGIDPDAAVGGPAPFVRW